MRKRNAFFLQKRVERMGHLILKLKRILSCFISTKIDDGRMMILDNFVNQLPARILPTKHFLRLKKWLEHALVHILILKIFLFNLLLKGTLVNSHYQHQAIFKIISENEYCPMKLQSSSHHQHQICHQWINPL